MNRIALIADVHVGNHKKHGGKMEASLNRRCRQTLDTLRRAVVLAQDRRAEAFVVLGDLFDTTRPTPQMIASVQSIFAQFSGKIVLLVGNHERVSDAWGDHALAPLAHCAEIVETPTVVYTSNGLPLVCVPYFANAAEMIELVTNASLVPDGNENVLCMHQGIVFDDTPAHLASASDALGASHAATVGNAVGARAVFAGHWHHHRYDPMKTGLPSVCQVGALAPRGWSEPGGLQAYGRIAFLDSSPGSHRVKFETLPGPRFLDYGTHTLIEDACWSYMRFRVPMSALGAAQEELARLIDEDCLVDGHVEMRDEDAERAAVEAATVAARSDTLDEAVAAYVHEREWDEGVDRDLLLDMVRRFLEGDEYARR